MILLILMGILLVLMILVGGKRGGISFALLLGDGFLCFLGILLLSFNVSPYAVLITGCIVFLILAVPVQNGLNQKTLTVMISTILILIPIAVLIGVVCANAHLVGLDEYQISQMENSYLASGVKINMGGVMLLSLVLSELGAIIDAGMTIASSMQEIHVNNPSLSQGELTHAGMQVGRDIIGTTINTLAFIAFGETVMLCLLYIADGYSLTVLLNSKSFFQQFGGILFSCESCLLVIPLTVRIYIRVMTSGKISAFFEKRKK